MDDPVMLAWERADEGAGHSLARRQALAEGWLFHGNEVLIGDDTLACWFRVRLDEAWVTREVHVVAVSAAGERSLDMVADDRRVWTVDGVHEPSLDGCIDVDVAATPLTNTFPIRRLAGVEVGRRVTTPIAWVDVPALTVSRVEQTYERLGPTDGLERWRYSDPLHGDFVLEVDDEGLVVDYEGFARRVRRDPARP